MRVVDRILLVLAAVLSPAMASGQIASLSSTGKSSEEEKPVQIVLYPAPEPQPALKYQLLPPFMERRPGNAAVHYLKVPHEEWNLYGDGEFWDTVCKWAELPLPELRKARELDQKSKSKAGRVSWLGSNDPGWMLGEIERGARCESCDWDIPVREHEFVSILLPEVQSMRSLARMLVVRARLQMADGKYDEAVRTLQTCYALGRHVGQPGICLVQCLVGVTIASMASCQVETFIQQPDAPNLYWALSTLPRPLVDFRLAGEAESKILYLQFPELRDLDKKRLSPDEWRELLRKIVRQSRMLLSPPPFSPPPLSPETYMAAVTALAVNGYPHAKRYLIDHGRTAAEVEAMPVAQVVLLYTVKLYDELSDAQFKWFYLPAAEAGTGPQRADRELHDALAAKREIIPLASILLPASVAAKQAETRSEWTIARLRVFEAMRLYAANHGGRWPNHLTDITEVPVPMNPYDGKPFIYQREGDKAIVTCSERGPMNVPWRYEITLMQRETQPTAKETKP